MKKRNFRTLVIFGLLLFSTFAIVIPVNQALIQRAPPNRYCTITSPTNGETVSGIVTITVDASQTPDILIDGVKVADSYTFDWDTTLYGDGSHTIQAKVPARSDTISVTVSNGGTVDNPPTVTIDSPNNDATVSGSVNILITVNDEDTLTADIYIDGSYVATSNNYLWDTTTYTDASHTIYAEATDSQQQTGNDQISVTVDNGGSSGGDGIVNKYAIIVGISDYKAISDLSYCDEDATDWYWQLNSMGYSIQIFGDGHTSNYPIHTGYATEYNVKNALLNMMSTADEDDIIAFVSSGHGGATQGPPHRRTQYLCMWDCGSGESGEDGYFDDVEVAAIFANSVSKTFIFLDHCYSGGLNEIMDNANSALIYMATTCTDNGYGYDDPDSQNGLWTHYFLEFSWQNYYGGSSTVSMEQVFAYAHANYPVGGGDEPQEFDGTTGTPFYL